MRKDSGRRTSRIKPHINIGWQVVGSENYRSEYEKQRVGLNAEGGTEIPDIVGLQLERIE